MKTALAICICLAVAANALPSDSVVPENHRSLYNHPHDEAVKTITTMLQTGAATDDCKKLATTTINDVKASIKNMQKVLDGLPNGQVCPNEGQQAVDAAERDLKNAQKAHRAAEKEAHDARNALVNFPPMPLSSVSANGNSLVVSASAGSQLMQNYLSAKARSNAANKAEIMAAGRVKQAHIDIKDAKEAQVKAINACQCMIRSEHDKAHKSAQDATPNNKKAWEKGHYMLCVLAHTALGKCNVGGMPGIRKPTLHAGVVNAKCGGHAKKAKAKRL